MSKPKMKYKTAVMKDPKTKEIIADKRRPHIVEVRIYNLDELVKFALDNNYIEGAKYELAKGIVKGAIEAERALIQAGNAVSVDGWVKYEPRLKGSVPEKTRQLTAKENALIVGITALKELKLTLDTFSWQLVDEGFKPEPDPDPDPDPEPPTPTGPTVTAINDGTFHTGAGNVITGIGMRFADEYPCGHIVIKNSSGDDMEAMISDDTSVPRSETTFAISIDEGTPLTVGEEYTFEFEMLDDDDEPVTVTHTARWSAA